jgi:hypothetical protein
MRALIMIAGVLILAACGNNDQTDNTMNVDESLTAENIVSNDVTAIDAVTGDAANMAAEAEINDVGATSPIEGNEAGTKPAAKPAAKRSTPPRPAPAAAPSAAASNSAD